MFIMCYRLLNVFSLYVNSELVMDKIAKRPKGFAFIRYETEEEAQKAIEGMHGKVCSTYHFLRKL